MLKYYAAASITAKDAHPQNLVWYFYEKEDAAITDWIGITLLLCNCLYCAARIISAIQ